VETRQDGGQPYKPVGYSCDHKGHDGDYTGGELWYFVSDDGTDSLKDLCAGDSIVLTVNEPVLMDGNKKDSVCSVKKEDGMVATWLLWILCPSPLLMELSRRADHIRASGFRAIS